jgi:4-alpha-glucanotransferase
MNRLHFDPLTQRSSGVLLHITSLPGPHGSGDLGAQAYHFVDWLASAGQRLWQILPLSPVGPGYSPYHSPSTFAGNPWLVDLDQLVQCGWLTALPEAQFEAGRCDFERLAPYRMRCLRSAWQGFLNQAKAADVLAFERFRAQEAHWLEGYALFMALEARYGESWTQWPPALARSETAALTEAANALADELGFYSFNQWCFSVQWQRLRHYAREKGVLIVGDAPIFVAHHSADVWLNTAQYDLDAHGEPRVVAGVPPDHFSETGQRWGNPLYRWEAMASDDFLWWKARLNHLLNQVDVVRLDHFRGFDAYWEIPATQPTAAAGHWCQGPGTALFEALARPHQKAQSPLPFIAEDLGQITPNVTALRQAFGFPGMRVMQFAFGDTAANPYLPHNFEARTVAYTGTHDNDTSLGWWHKAGERERQAARHYLGPLVDTEIHWAMMQALSQSVANTVIFPLQDVLGLDGAHRMNTPGVARGCWAWRFEWQQVQSQAQRLAELTQAHGRYWPLPDAPHPYIDRHA